MKITKEERKRRKIRRLLKEIGHPGFLKILFGIFDDKRRTA